MSFKVVNISDPGTATRHGADDQDKIAKLLNGVDIIDPAIINTDFIFKNNKLTFRDLSDQFNIKILTSGETQSGSITIPTLDGNVTMLLDNDSRLYDARDPNPHTITHQSGQSDAIPIDQLAAPTDVNNLLLNATSTAHGLMPTLPADGLLYLDGNGNWTAPSGTGIIADGSLNNAKLADNTITELKIAPGTISNASIAAGANIAQSKLATISITDTNVAVGAAIAWSKISKTGSKLEDMADVNVTGRGDQMLIKWDATTAKYVFYTPAAGGGAVIPDDNSVSTAKIQALAVTGAKIANATITATQLANNAITTALITDGNVTLAKLASNSVDSSKIVDGSIMNADINSAAAIGWGKISKVGSITDDLGDVALSYPIGTGDVMTWNGSSWANQALSSPASNDSANPVYPNKKTGWIMGGMSSSNDLKQLGGGILANAFFENTINGGVDSDGAYSELSSTSTSNTFARIYGQDSGSPFLTSLHPTFYFGIKFPNAGNIRAGVFFTDESPIPTNQFNLLDSQVGIGVYVDTTQNSNLLTVRSNGGTQSTDSWYAPSSGTYYDIKIQAVSGSTWTVTINGSTRTYSSNTPSSSSTMSWGIVLNTNTGAVRTMRLYYAYVTQDA